MPYENALSSTKQKKKKQKIEKSSISNSMNLIRNDLFDLSFSTEKRSINYYSILCEMISR